MSMFVLVMAVMRLGAEGRKTAQPWNGHAIYNRHTCLDGFVYSLFITNSSKVEVWPF